MTDSERLDLEFTIQNLRDTAATRDDGDTYTRGMIKGIEIAAAAFEAKLARLVNA